MNQLQAFLSSLNEAEINTISRLKFKGKEKEVFSAVLKYLQGDIDRDISKELKITETHYYKICSLILQRCYSAITPDGGIDLIKFLLSKRLYSQFKHEIPKQEKALIKKEDSVALEKYYLNVFHLLIDLPFKQYDVKLRALIGSKYATSNVKFGKAEEAYIKFHSLFSDANRLAAQKNPTKAFGYKLEDLQKFENEIKSTNFYLGQYYLYRTFCSYYSYYDFNPQKNIEYLKKAVALKKEIAWFFPINIGQFLELLVADALFVANETDEAFTMYAKVFKENISNQIYGYHYHCEQFALLLIIKEKFDEAEKFISKCFDADIKLNNDIYGVRGQLCYAKLYLSSHNLAKAQKHIISGKNQNEKSYYLPFDFQFRVLENIYFIKKGDLDFAGKLAQKNLKFVTSQKKDSQLYAEYVMLFKLLVQRCKENFSTKEITEKSVVFNSKFKNLYANIVTNAFSNYE